MKGIGIGAIGLGLAVLGLQSFAAGPEPSDPAVAPVVRRMHAWAQRDFSLPKEVVLDADLRATAEQLAQEQIASVEALLGRWAAEEAASLSAAQRERELEMRIVARYINEMALWQLDTTGDVYDRLMLQALSRPGLCAAQLEQAPFAQAMVAIQQLPAAQRQAALDGQRQLLARWGQRRASVPERPVPSLLERAEQAARSLSAVERPPSEPPLPPRLAWFMLDSPARPLDVGARCSLRQWWLQRDVAASPASVAALAAAIRYATLMEPLERLRLPTDAIDTATAYPPVALRFGVEGRVQVRGTVRAATVGLDQPLITSRQISVPGIRDVRPVAFETVLDAASLARAKTVQPTRGAPGQATALEFVWKVQP